jgi:hypothetical protein
MTFRHYGHADVRVLTETGKFLKKLLFRAGFRRRRVVIKDLLGGANF